MTKNQPLVHDVSGDIFQNGITNFTVENVFDALQSIGLEKHLSFSPEKLTLKLHTKVLDRMWRLNLIDQKLKVNDEHIIVAQNFYLMGIPVNEYKKIPHSGPIFDNLIYHDCQLKCILRSREF